MTDYDRGDTPSIHRNDPSMQVYFGNEFANDSQFPLEPGDDAVAWLEGGAVVICPLDELANLPDSLDGPPPDAVPGDYVSDLPDGPTFDPGLVDDASTDQHTTTDAGHASRPADAASDDTTQHD